MSNDTNMAYTHVTPVNTCPSINRSHIVIINDVAYICSETLAEFMGISHQQLCDQLPNQSCPMAVIRYCTAGIVVGYYISREGINSAYRQGWLNYHLWMGLLDAFDDKQRFEKRLNAMQHLQATKNGDSQTTAVEALNQQYGHYNDDDLIIEIHNRLETIAATVRHGTRIEQKIIYQNAVDSIDLLNYMEDRQQSSAQRPAQALLGNE